MGAAATFIIAGTVAIGRPEPIGVALALLGAAYGLILAVDITALDTRAAIVGAALLAVGELAYRSLEARAAAAEEGGAVATRVAWIGAQSLVALLFGGMLLVFIDVVRAGGIAAELAGAGVAVIAAGILIWAVRAGQAAGRQGDAL